MYKRNITLEYFLMFTKNFNITHAIWMIYLVAKGFSYAEVGIFEGIFHISSLTMEIPTGAVADIYGRKTSRALSLILFIIYLLILAFSNDFILIAIGFVLCGISYTLESGAGDALVYDSLLEEGNEKTVNVVNGRREMIYQGASILAAVVGGYIATYNQALVFKLMIGITIIALAILSFMRETTIDKHPEGLKKEFKTQYIDSFKFVFQNKRLILYIVIGNLIAFPVTTLFFYSQNYFTLLGYSEFIVGSILALHSVCAIIGAWIVTKIHIKDAYIFTIIPIIMIALMWAYLTQIGWIAFVLLGAFESVMYVVVLNHMNHIIPSDKRATVLSISSMMFSVMMILVFPVVGLLSDLYSFKVGFLFNAGIVTIGYIVYLIRYRQFNAE